MVQIRLNFLNNCADLTTESENTYFGFQDGNNFYIASRYL